MLEALQIDGHVMMMSIGLVGGGLEGGLKKVSRHEATTFRGLCSDHDRQLFERLDLGALDANDAEVRALLSWRAITYELHQTIEAAGRIQSAYLKKVKSGELDGDVPSPAGIEATSWMVTAYETFRYRSDHWDVSLSNPSGAAVEYLVYGLSDVPPILAASRLFSFQPKKNSTACRIALNIWPDDAGHTIVLFGFCKVDGGRAKRFIRTLLDSEGDLHPAKLSAALLQHLGNFVLNPSHVENWSDEKRQFLERAFLSTVIDKRRVVASKMINLFL
ncbi:MAG: hypothetical protein QUV02_02320 [Maricaulis sp.]|uniref:hypothetical protein n=1 Tax=Maricaulis sp. TaxID=1486257 RepID=UPI00261A2EF1|nr:hypothetical protein [Maricaulis sp.]MDM7983257.1 hypothetical protein [Maricaulis sp.]